ncbi:NAD(P)/FAD-dependent oxidoreductase [Novosphingobium sp. 1949]|uniref:Pyridine nucleotide-disulfide oxidoreductase domain-containing protein 2 n=1 Tax=Novosphingobium organovorum TaxID=2930092 RepID=A0ABT0BFN1_9SPHN|nr:NAD(P)/FAD-dependent oxidoreductase [Novosphingobium organovorum]MCJ2183601.1 NAD(P)/FAD-dependent oxidoreductase [Novosphingobium organovorum]
MSTYDIVVMGAGHNGLVAAAYMAKAGKKVLVLERKPHYGGGVSTRELIQPGFWHDEHSNVHIMIQGNPMLREDELGLLSKFGLEYIYPELPHASIFDDGTMVRSWRDLDRTCEEIARFSPRDAEAYRKFAQTSMQALPMFMSGLYSPPFPMGAFVAMMDQSDEGRFLLDVMQRSALDVVNQYFESDLLKIHIVRMVTENLQMPDELGTGMGAFLMPGIIHAYGCSMPKGGSGQLSHALVRAIEHFGGEVRCNSEVRRVIVQGGKATGLELTDGETFMARDGVIGAIHPHVLRKFVSETPEPVLQRAERVTQSTFSINLTHLTLKERLKLKVGNETNAMMTELLDFYTVRDMCLEYDKLRRGEVSERLIAGGDNTIFDPSRAPEGAGVFYGVNFAPYDLYPGGPGSWDERKEEIADKALNQYRKFYSNLTDDNITGRLIRSPIDHERDSPASFLKGDIHGCAPFFYQTVAHRPTPDLGSLRVPEIEGLYLVGPFMHPGGGVFGAGRATAIQMMDDLDIEYDKVCGEAV